MKVINIESDGVIQMLSTGTEVYKIDANKDEVVNLMYCTVETVLKEVEDKDNGFFIVIESEDK